VGSERNTDYTFGLVKQWFLRATRRTLDLVIANSHAGAVFHRRHFGSAQDRYEVLYNGLDTDRFQPASVPDALRAEFDPERKHFLIGMFANYKRQKNHPMAVKAFKLVLEKIPHARLLLIGESYDDGGKCRVEVTQLIREYEMEASCLQLGNRSDVVDFYNLCDITILPSFHEGLPNVVLESMACGTPAVVTDVSDNARLVRDGVSGYVVKVGEVEKLAERIVELAGDRERLEQFSKAARAEAIDRFSRHGMAENLATIYATHLARCGGH
jgi:glycosyltransferase involved in cell wall biosynthesis